MRTLMGFNMRTKDIMKDSAERGLTAREIINLRKKRRKILNDYQAKLIVYFILLIIFNLFFAYCCICYGGIFPNSVNGLLVGFLYTLILSFIICALLCFINVIIYKFAVTTNSTCIKKVYFVLRTIY